LLQHASPSLSSFLLLFSSSNNAFFFFYTFLLFSLRSLAAICDSWDYRFLIYCFVIFSYVPAFVELLHILKFIVVDYDIMKQIEIRV